MEKTVKKENKKVEATHVAVKENEKCGFAEWLQAKKKLESLPRGITADKAKVKEALKELSDIEEKILKQL